MTFKKAKGTAKKEKSPPTTKGFLLMGSRHAHRWIDVMSTAPQRLIACAAGIIKTTGGAKETTTAVSKEFCKRRAALSGSSRVDDLFLVASLGLAHSIGACQQGDGSSLVPPPLAVRPAGFWR